MSLRLSCCWPFCQWLPCIARTSERLPKRYSSVLKWGNLHSPAYPLLLASWLACSHLLSKSISGSLSSLSTCTSVEIFFNFVNVCDFLKPVLIGSTRPDFLLSVPWLGPAGQRCPVWPSWGIMTQVLPPQLPSHSEIRVSSPLHYLFLYFCGADCLHALSK